MTIICTYFNSPADYAMASDTEGCCDGRRVRSGPKVHANGAVLFGGHGLLAQTQRGRAFLSGGIGYATKADLLAKLRDLHDLLAERVGAPTDGDVKSTGCGWLTVGPWGIIEMDYSGAIVEHGRWAAVGSGGEVGTGALFVLDQFVTDRGVPGDRYFLAEVCRLAVQAAIALNNGCGGEAVVLVGDNHAT